MRFSNRPVSSLLRHGLTALALALAAPLAMASTSTTASAAQSHSDIVDTAVAAGQFNTLAAALQAAGLVDTLKGTGPFTVFAPTDAAFAALPAGTVENLLKPENKQQLIAVLTYHVVTGLSEAATVQGGKLAVASADGAVSVGGARVVTADVMASNGVIHVIDKVLLPAQ